MLFISIPFINAVTVFDSFGQIWDRDNIFIYFDIFSIFMAAVFISVKSVLIRKGTAK